MTGTSLTTGDDIESALDIISENGGLGEWEGDEANAPAVPRWLFPRFDGAENIGTCDKGKAHEGVHAKTKTCKDWMVDQGNMYLSRPGIGGYDTDVETIGAWLAAPRNVVGMVLIEGNPGSGKTAAIEAAACHAERELVTHLCTPDDTRDSLMLRFVGEGKGWNGTPYDMGALPKAVERGATFYADEFFMLTDGTKIPFYQLADGRHVLSGGYPDGTDIEVHPNFRLIVSSNPQVRGASLPEPIGSRAASTTLTIETSASMLLDLGIDSNLVAVWSALGTQNLWRPEIRELRMADYWMQMDSMEQAASAFLPSHCPESQRAAIRDLVVSYIGSEIRQDGRLVVR